MPPFAVPPRRLYSQIATTRQLLLSSRHARIVCLRYPPRTAKFSQRARPTGAITATNASEPLHLHNTPAADAAAHDGKRRRRFGSGSGGGSNRRRSCGASFEAVATHNSGHILQRQKRCVYRIAAAEAASQPLYATVDRIELRNFPQA